MGRIHPRQAPRQEQVRRPGDLSGEPLLVHAPPALDGRRDARVPGHPGTREDHQGPRGILPSQGPGSGHREQGRPLRGLVQEAPLSGPVRLPPGRGREQNQHLRHPRRAGERGKVRPLPQASLPRPAHPEPDPGVLRAGLQQQRFKGGTIPSSFLRGGGRGTHLLRVYDRALRLHPRRRRQVVPRPQGRNRAQARRGRARLAR
mmetsp:Transcript_4068/g.8855  ORF Transcript_4068/g.8855 Transcript_4068/m.8855 type:complete len:203 (+) Transcript_4068:532-1140(+)